MQRKIFEFLFCLSLALFAVYFNPNQLYLVKAEETTISAGDALNLAAAHVNSDRAINEESFKDNIHVSETNVLYDLKGNVTAYLFQFEDSDKAASGYVIVGATHKQAAIIEYAYDGTCFLYKARATVMEKEYETASNLVFYYMGGLDYYIGIKKNSYIYFVSSNGLSKISRSVVVNSTAYEFSDEEQKKVSQSWTDLENNVIENFSVSKPTINNIIFSKSTYKSAYTTINYGAVNNYAKLDYFINDRLKNYDFHQLSAAICGANLLLYWRNQNDEYANLLQKSWTSLMEDFLYDMGTFENSQTYPENFYQVMKDYFKDYANGCKSSAYYATDVKWERITDEINAGCPIVLVFQGNRISGYQYVLGLGYKEFVSSTSSSDYILIADGQMSKAARHIYYAGSYEDVDGIGAIGLRPF